MTARREIGRPIMVQCKICERIHPEGNSCPIKPEDLPKKLREKMEIKIDEEKK